VNRIHYLPPFRTFSLKSLYFVLLITGLLILPVRQGSPEASAIVTVEVIHSRDQYPAGGTYPVLFLLRVEQPWYIHGVEDSGDGLIPTALSFSSPPGIRLGNLRFPEPQKLQFGYTPEPVELYSGTLRVGATLLVQENAPVGKQAISGTLSYQPCSPHTCLPPEAVEIRFEALVAPEGTASEALNQEHFALKPPPFPQGPREPLETSTGAGFWLSLVGIFLGGLALNLTPCIYPLIPITVSYFGGRGHQSRGKGVFHGFLYILGLALTNSALGLTAALSGGLLGAALQNPYLLAAVAAILFTLGLNLFGFWELRIPSGLVQFASRSFGGYRGTFFMGLTLGIVAAPCLGPFILGLLTYVSQRGDPFLGFLYFFVLSLGLGLPLSLLAVFSGTLDKLPLSGEWMIWIRKGLGWVLVGMAAYMIWPLVPGHAWKSALMGGILASAGLHLGWIEKSGRGKDTRFQRAKKWVGGLLVLGAMFVLISGLQKGEGIHWIPYHPERIEEAALEGRPVIIDFYADWCSPCREMDNQVFSDPEVVELGRSFVALRVDLTSHNPFQEQLQEKYRIRGVPTIVFLDKNGAEMRPLRVESFLGRTPFLKRMKEALDQG
jgi:thioredoxin:protein disulfide reductase